jgi:hypothetical protein
MTNALQAAKDFLRDKGYMYADMDKHPELLVEFAERHYRAATKAETCRFCPTCGSSYKAHRGNDRDDVGVVMRWLCCDPWHSPAPAMTSELGQPRRIGAEHCAICRTLCGPECWLGLDGKTYHWACANGAANQ